MLPDDKPDLPFLRFRKSENCTRPPSVETKEAVLRWTRLGHSS